MELGLNGKLALVTGGSHGVGLATAISLASEGCSLICAARDREKLLSVKEQVESIGQDCLIYEFDALEKKSVMKLSATLLQNSQSQIFS